MDVVFSFNIKQRQEEGLHEKFPEVTFHFNKKLEDVEIQTATVIVTYGEDIDVTLLDRAKSLKWIMVAAAGVEKMPIAEIAERNIVMSNVRGIHKTPMAESILAHILALQRSLPLIYEQQSAKEWTQRVGSVELKGTTALILGPGAIGTETGRLLQAFGVRTIGCNRSGKESESMDETIKFEELMERLGEADFVISVLPSTVETKGMLTKEYFNAMKTNTVFMNFGRGDLFDESVLVAALKNGEIRHAVLDVFKKEPLPVGNELWEIPNCTVSPHVSSLSGKYVERALGIFEENLKKWLQGERNLENLIDYEVGY